jgi:dihydroneopterin aldolase
VIGLECSTDARAAALTDELSATIDYTRLKEIAVAVATGGSYRLIETMAERIARAIIDELRPRWLRVRVTKVNPPGLGVPASVEVERGDVAVARGAPIDVER